MTDVQNIYSWLIGLMRDGKSEHEAIETLREMLPAHEAVDLAIARYHEVANQIISVDEPKAMADRDSHPHWYTGSRPGDEFWPKLREKLATEGFPEEAIESIDRASTKIVAHLPPPWLRHADGRGLVLGYVQSGKTSNYTAVMAKAADAGYRLFIVLSGMHNNLRRQTQVRLEEQLRDTAPRRWHALTTDEADFGHPGNAESLLSQNELRILAVVKKNKRRLLNLLEWLNSASNVVKQNCPILIIDDEADQASVNTKSAEDRAVINNIIIELLDQPMVSYVGYTATPFANLFIDPTIPADLYPRDFVIDLPRPTGYFGPEKIFGREALNGEEANGTTDIDGLDVVRIVEQTEAQLLQPPRKKEDRVGWIPPITRSLATATRYFLLATAARHARGQVDKHSSMLIHTTRYVQLHNQYRPEILALIDRVRNEVATNSTNSLRQLWEEEMSRVPSEEELETPVPFEELLGHLPRVLDEVTVVVDNSQSEDRLAYGSRAGVVIVIGGDTLSRGLTLEGLVVSYFLRTASAYDTLLQMGRWFGYRRGYSDLPRIWMTDELSEYFQFLSTVEAEIRTDVARYQKEDLTPLEFGVRVRTHPQLAITSALKMQAAVDAEVSYSGRRLQTILFNNKDSAWLKANLQATYNLVDSIRNSGSNVRDNGTEQIAHEIDVGLILRFLREYEFHPDAQDLNNKLIHDYILAQNRYSELHKWNVAIMGRQDAIRGHIDLGIGSRRNVGLVNRAPLSTLTPRPHVNIKTLMSRRDRVIDLELTDDVETLTAVEMQSIRPKGVGLLLIYPIDKDSMPLRGKKRTALEAAEHMIGVGIVFPSASTNDGTPLRYKAVALPLGDVEDPETEDIEALDTEADYDSEG